MCYATGSDHLSIEAFVPVNSIRYFYLYLILVCCSRALKPVRKDVVDRVDVGGGR
jgi:hypothetical protein